MSNVDTSLSGLLRCAILYGFMIVFSVIESSLNLAKNMSNHKILLHSRLTVPNVPSSNFMMDVYSSKPASVGLIPGEEVLIMDWYNMTKNAQTSDGLHHLTDVNLAKAAQILYLVENWPFP